MKEDVWLRRVKVAIASVLILVAVLLLSTAGAVFWAVNNPRKAFALAEKYVLPADLKIKWEQMDFDAKRVTWRNWEIDWSTAKLTVDKGSPEIHLPVEQASMKFALSFFQPGPLLSFRELKVATGESASFRSSAEEPAAKTAQSPFEQFQTYLEYLKTGSKWLTVENMNLQVPKFALLSSDGKSESIISAKLTKPGKDQNKALADFEVTFADGVNKFAAKGWADTTKLDVAAPFLKLDAEGAGKGWKIKTAASGFYQGETAKFETESDLAVGEPGKEIKAHPKLNVTMTAAEAFLKLQSPVINIPGPMVKIEKLEAELRVPFDNGYAWSERPAAFKVWFPADLFFVDKDMRPPLEKSCRCKIPERLVVTYEGRAWLEHLLGKPADSTTVLDSKLSVEGVDNKLLTVNLNAHLKVNKLGEEWILEPRLDSSVLVQSFQGLRQFLDARNVMIPAPLDILDGKISLLARGSVDHDDKLIRTAVDIKVALNSPTQKIDIESTVRLNLTRDFKSLDVIVQTLIKELKIELPPIDPIRGIPSLKTDSRLVFKQAEPKKSSAFKMRVFFDVKTVNPGAVKLLSKLADPYAPITVDVNNNKQGESSGSLRLEPFTLTYLRRKVMLERLQMTLTENEDGDFPIGGRLRIDQTAYKIFVDIAGTAGSPIINLNSEPYLERADIISVLLFDRVSGELVSADADTAGGVNAAMADRAIGLFGLWAFATTPIRSFSYNAVTKVYTATVQLADGLTAGVGTNWERAAHLEVRKRVSRRWVLTASWSPTEDHQQVGKLVLQWEKRF